MIGYIIREGLENFSKSLRGIVNSVSYLASNAIRSSVFNLHNALYAFAFKDPITNSRLTGFKHLLSIPKDLIMLTFYSVRHFLFSAVNLVTFGAVAAIIDYFREVKFSGETKKYEEYKKENIFNKSSDPCVDFMANRFKEEADKNSFFIDIDEQKNNTKLPNRNFIQSFDSAIRSLFQIPTKIINHSIKVLISIPQNIATIIFGYESPLGVKISRSDAVELFFLQPLVAVTKIIFEDCFKNIFSAIGNIFNTLVRFFPGNHSIFEAEILEDLEQKAPISINKLSFYDANLTTIEKLRKTFRNKHTKRNNEAFTTLVEIQREVFSFESQQIG